MNKKNYIIVLISIGIIMVLSGCSKNNAQNFIKEKIDVAKQEVSDQVSQSVQGAIDNSMDSIAQNIESKLDPELGRLRENMKNIETTAKVYYNINKSFPDEKIIQTFFKNSFSSMNIEYSVENDSKKATIKYIGDKYDKEKVNDIIIGE